jgi:hypothetical protein
VVARVHKNVIASRTVAQALDDMAWVRDISTTLSLQGIHQYLMLWDIMEGVVLSQEDHHIWRHEASGRFSCESCYKSFFRGSITFEPWRKVWKSWAPMNCKVFLWSAIKNKCWIADRLERRGMNHSIACLFCDQEHETTQHILTSCVFARQFWHDLLAPLGLAALAPPPPQIDDEVFGEWRKVAKIVHKYWRKGVNNALGAWSLWLHRNRCVFEGARLSLHKLKHDFSNEVVCTFKEKN